MKFTPLPLAGAYQIDLQQIADTRGFFARSFCSSEYAQLGLVQTFVQMNHSMSVEKGTLRGMHYQLDPMAEVKIVRCVRGAIWDCLLDLRPESPTWGQWFGTELSARNYAMLYVPEGVAHGFLTLEPHSEVLYQVSQPYSKTHERGIRWNDPRFAIRWPFAPTVVSERDQQHPDYTTLELR